MKSVYSLAIKQGNKVMKNISYIYLSILLKAFSPSKLPTQYTRQKGIFMTELRVELKISSDLHLPVQVLPSFPSIMGLATSGQAHTNKEDSLAWYGLGRQR